MLHQADVRRIRKILLVKGVIAEMIGDSAHGIVEPGSNGGGRFSVDPCLLRCFQFIKRGYIRLFFGHAFRVRLGIGKCLVPFFREFGRVGIDMVGHTIFRDDV